MNALPSQGGMGAPASAGVGVRRFFKASGMVPPRFSRALCRSPYTWLVAGGGGGLLWAFVRWFEPSPAMLALALAWLGVLWGLWPVFLLRDPAFMAGLLRAPGELGSTGATRLAALETELARLKAGQPLAQLRLLRDKLDKLATVLRHRLDAGELTYGRYLGTAEQVYLAALDNLHEIALVLASQSPEDEAYVGRRLREIEADGVSERERLEYDTLTQRQALAERQRLKVEGWLAENERALTVLDNTAAALAETRTRAGHATLSAEEAIQELEALAGRTGRYASGR